MGETHAVAWMHRPLVKTVGHISGILCGRFMLRRGHTDLLLRLNGTHKVFHGGDSSSSIEHTDYNHHIETV